MSGYSCKVIGYFFIFYFLKNLVLSKSSSNFSPFLHLISEGNTLYNNENGLNPLFASSDFSFPSLLSLHSSNNSSLVTRKLDDLVFKADSKTSHLISRIPRILFPLNRSSRNVDTSTNKNNSYNASNNLSSSFSSIPPSFPSSLPPMFVDCPSKPIVYNNLPGKDVALVYYSIPSAYVMTSNENITKRIEGVVQGKQPGSFFPIGVHTVVVYAENENKQRSYCNIEIVVNDVEKPYFTSCPSSLEKVIETNEEKTFVPFEINAQDNSRKVPKIIQVEGRKSGEEFTLGKHKMLFAAYDDANNVSYCDFTINVITRDVASLNSNTETGEECRARRCNNSSSTFSINSFFSNFSNNIEKSNNTRNNNNYKQRDGGGELNNKLNNFFTNLTKIEDKQDNRIEKLDKDETEEKKERDWRKKKLAVFGEKNDEKEEKELEKENRREKRENRLSNELEENGRSWRNFSSNFVEKLGSMFFSYSEKDGSGETGGLGRNGGEGASLGNLGGVKLDNIFKRVGNNKTNGNANYARSKNDYNDNTSQPVKILTMSYDEKNKTSVVDNNFVRDPNIDAKSENKKNNFTLLKKKNEKKNRGLKEEELTKEEDGPILNEKEKKDKKYLKAKKEKILERQSLENNCEKENAKSLGCNLLKTLKIIEYIKSNNSYKLTKNNYTKNEEKVLLSKLKNRNGYSSNYQKPNNTYYSFSNNTNEMPSLFETSLIQERMLSNENEKVEGSGVKNFMLDGRPILKELNFLIKPKLIKFIQNLNFPFNGNALIDEVDKTIDYDGDSKRKFISPENSNSIIHGYNNVVHNYDNIPYENIYSKQKIENNKIKNNNMKELYDMHNEDKENNKKVTDQLKSTDEEQKLAKNNDDTNTFNRMSMNTSDNELHAILQSSDNIENNNNVKSNYNNYNITQKEKESNEDEYSLAGMKHFLFNNKNEKDGIMNENLENKNLINNLKSDNFLIDKAKQLLAYSSLDNEYIRHFDNLNRNNKMNEHYNLEVGSNTTNKQIENDNNSMTNKTSDEYGTNNNNTTIFDKGYSESLLEEASIINNKELPQLYIEANTDKKATDEKDQMQQERKEDNLYQHSFFHFDSSFPPSISSSSNSNTSRVRHSTASSSVSTPNNFLSAFSSTLPSSSSSSFLSRVKEVDWTTSGGWIEPLRKVSPIIQNLVSAIQSVAEDIQNDSSNNKSISNKRLGEENNYNNPLEGYASNNGNFSKNQNSYTAEKINTDEKKSDVSYHLHFTPLSSTDKNKQMSKDEANEIKKKLSTEECFRRGCPLLSTCEIDISTDMVDCTGCTEGSTIKYSRKNNSFKCKAID